MRDLHLDVAVFLLLVLATAAGAQSLTYTSGGFTDNAFATGVTSGTAMAFAPDGRLFVCEQGGALRVFSATGASLGSFVTLTVDSNGERGLLGVAFDPDYGVNRYVYVYYTVPAPGAPPAQAHNRVSRFTANATNPNVAVAASEIPILDLNNLSNSFTNHNGGAIHFGPDGKLYIAAGENAIADNSQTVANLLGKMLRINPDGSIPVDNPTSFTVVSSGGVPSTVTPTSVNRAIWAVGLRNPFTFAFQSGTGRMFINDVGSGGTASREEINEGVAGSNYGWPRQEGNAPANANFRTPVFFYARSATTPDGAAITGGAFYNPGAIQFPASYVGMYFFTDVTRTWMYTLDPSTAAVTVFATGLNQPVDVQTGPDGAVYCLNRGASQVLRIRYTGTTTQNIVASADSLTVNEGSAASFNVKLAVDPGTGNTVTVDVATALGNAPLNLSATQLNFTGGGAGTWNTYQTVTLTAPQEDSEADDGGVNVMLSSAGLTTQSVAVTVLDNDRPAGTPAARITLPRQGQVVGGANAEFFGDGQDTGGLTGAEFYVDGNLIASESNTTGHYHAGAGHASWNTTGLANGPHVLRMVVFDNAGPPPLSGAHQITVIVNNLLTGGGGGGGGGCGLSGLEVLLVLGGLALSRRR